MHCLNTLFSKVRLLRPRWDFLQKDVVCILSLLMHDVVLSTRSSVSQSCRSPIRHGAWFQPALALTTRKLEFFQGNLRRAANRSAAGGGWLHRVSAQARAQLWVLKEQRGGRAAPNQPVGHLLQLCKPRGAAGQEDHRAWLLVLLHPCQDDAEPPQPRVPRLPHRQLPQPRLLRCGFLQKTCVDRVDKAAWSASQALLY